MPQKTAHEIPAPNAARSHGLHRPPGPPPAPGPQVGKRMSSLPAPPGVRKPVFPSWKQAPHARFHLLHRPFSALHEPKTTPHKEKSSLHEPKIALHERPKTLRERKKSQNPALWLLENPKTTGKTEKWRFCPRRRKTSDFLPPTILGTPGRDLGLPYHARASKCCASYRASELATRGARTWKRSGSSSTAQRSVRERGRR